MLSAVSDSYRFFASEKNKNDKEFKDIEQKLKLLFNNAFSKDQIKIPSAADVLNHFQCLFQQIDDDIIQKIFFTSFRDFG